MKMKDLRKLTISKRLNFLLGSGCSTNAIPLMRYYQDNCENLIQANNKLEEKVKQVSEVLANEKYEEIEAQKEVNKTLKTYVYFIQKVIETLNLSNSRETPRKANIFTTNYDLFIEKAFDVLSRDYQFIINDGSRGYFDKILESSNFDQVVSYKGINDNYISELPSISLIKPHGSMNWDKDEGKERVCIRNNIVQNPLIVKPTGMESADTFSQNHFFSMLRFFTNELDKPQSILVVVGFSFQDKHIAKMVKRATANSELLIMCFCFSASDVESILTNLGFELNEQIPRNIQFIVPIHKNLSNLEKKNYNLNIIERNNLTLFNVIEFMNGVFDEKD
ncbi:SIR2 family protein [Lactobacillus taiwanensis]|uniref:SIR2 family protein n=1 Tax=Lactobacillus taiwanensis TaxID=508451 RepID=UPI0024302487|nr:SIR2 family protein [Lactobacillus taiwanensis]